MITFGSPLYLTGLIIVPMIYLWMRKTAKKNDNFVEPFLPNYKIGIMHLAAGIWVDNKDMRLDKNVKIKIKTLQNANIEKSLI